VPDRPAAWRTLHHVTFPAFAGATAHGILAGSDSGFAWAWWSYVTTTVAVVFPTVYRHYPGTRA